MHEQFFEIEIPEPRILFGVNNNHLDLIESAFPKLKVVARGNTIKVHGEPQDISLFDNVIAQLKEHIERYNAIRTEEVKNYLEGMVLPKSKQGSDIILHGANGKLIKARTPNQLKMVQACQTNDLLFAIGPAGTGKTYTAVALAVQALRDKQVKRIILCRPAVEAGESLGFLPGDLKEKLDPYLQPLYDALKDMIPAAKLEKHLEKGVIEIAPLAFMRGRTLDNAFVILDEAQNATTAQLRMFLTRMGMAAKFIITGDKTQIDLPKKIPSGLIYGERILKNVEGISFIELDGTDVIRHPLVRRIISAYEKSEK